MEICEEKNTSQILNIAKIRIIFHEPDLYETDQQDLVELFDKLDLHFQAIVKIKSN